ncbi:hypothetical protein L7F22_004599 [Adiantum nelumboides]|nr:hypothetical protein [Adiantum nelumboides]
MGALQNASSSKLDERCISMRKRSHKHRNGFVFHYLGFIEFDISELPPPHQNPQDDSFQDQQNTLLNDKGKDQDEDPGIETYLFGGGKTLVIQFSGDRWGESSPDLVVITTSKTSFKDKIAPCLGMIVKCSIKGTYFQGMGLSSVELYLPETFISLNKSNGICLWKELFNTAVLDRTTIGPSNLHWPICNPASVDDPQESADQLNIDSQLLPIRVIKLQATISSQGGVCFYKPTNWSFHTISHTWSLGVRALSIAVGKLVSNAHELYDTVFKDTNFLDDNPIFFDDPQICKGAPECYSHLNALFQLLWGEGVKAVWFVSTS